MKKVFILLSCICLALGSFAQASTLTNCKSINISPSNPGAGVTPGLSPTDSFLPCAVIGSVVNDTIVFINYRTVTFSGTTVNLTSLTIDSLYLPEGLCWSTNSVTNTFLAGDSGFLYVTGSPTDSAGQYKLRIIVTADVSGITETVNAESATGLAYRVRVINSGCGCPTIDNSSADSAAVYLPYDTCLPLGIKTIPTYLSNVTVIPNPITSASQVTFSSEVNGAYTVSMMNLLGEVVATKEMNVTVGNNITTIERNGLTPGVYILSIADGKSATTKKIVIE